MTRRTEPIDFTRVFYYTNTGPTANSKKNSLSMDLSQEIYRLRVRIKSTLTINNYWTRLSKYRGLRDTDKSRYFAITEFNKHLMTGPKGNSEFCFPATSMFIEVRGASH